MSVFVSYKIPESSEIQRKSMKSIELQKFICINHNKIESVLKYLSKC